MSLTKTLEQIKVNKPFADENIHEGNPATYKNRLGRKNSAKEEVKRLREVYIEELRLSSVFILVAGNEKQAFLNAAKEFGCFSADAEGFYTDLTNSVNPLVYINQSASASMLDILGRYLEEKASDLQIVSYPQLVFKQQYSKMLHTKEDFKNFVKQTINDQVGSEISGLYALRSIADEAIERGHDGKLTAIVMASDDEKLILDLANSLKRIQARAFMVVAGKGAKTIRSTEGTFTLKEINEDIVKNVMTTIKGLCR